MEIFVPGCAVIAIKMSGGLETEKPESLVEIEAAANVIPQIMVSVVEKMKMAPNYIAIKAVVEVARMAYGAVILKVNMNKNNIFLSPGHNACAGCGQLVAAQAVMRGLNKDVIIANATGCLEVTTTAYPQSAWGLPWIHSLFENAAALASGIVAALNKKNDVTTKVVVQAGDGGTYDIGLGLISGMWERGENILYICYDTEAYSNTGIQASGATPYGADTTTSPSGINSIGSNQRKKDMLALAIAHGVSYVAQASAGFPDDITNKIKKALTVKGSSYIQILSPCIPGWKINNDEAVMLGKLAVQTGLYPLLEYTDSQLTGSSINSNFIAKPVEEYLNKQGRFKHLHPEDIIAIQKLASENIRKYKI
jgi:pyruvate ferredoxin oxidoreductase beta subunit